MNGKKSISAMITVALMSTLIAACGGNGDGKKPESGKSNINETGIQIGKEKINLKGFAGKFFASADWSNLKLWQEYEKMTNIHIDWDTVQVDTLPEKRNIILASGDYPDVFYASAFPKSDLIKYGSQGTFIKLNDLIDKYAPNFKKLMQQNPVVAKGIMMPDGSIYGFPTILDPEFKSVLTSTPWMKKEWLDKLGLQEPKTLDEFYNVLKAIKEKDPNGNGKPDEIPYGAIGVGGIISFVSGAFGLNNHGTGNAYVDLDPKTNNLRFVPADPRYKEVLDYVSKLYKDGLLDKEIFSIKQPDFYSRASGGIYGFTSSVNPVAIFNQEGYIGTPVLKGPYGDQMNTAVRPPLGNIGQFVITDKNKNPEATVRWMDYWYSDEGARMFFMGWKDLTYKELPNGELEYTDDIVKNPNGLNLDQAVSQYMIWPGGYYAGIVKNKFFKGAEGRPTSIDNAKKAEPYTIKDVWPAFNFTPAEQDELTTLAKDIETYVTEMRDKFASGAAPLSDWDKYVSTLNKIGVDKYMKIYQASYERFKKN